MCAVTAYKLFGAPISPTTAVPSPLRRIVTVESIPIENELQNLEIGKWVLVLEIGNLVIELREVRAKALVITWIFIEVMVMKS